MCCRNTKPCPTLCLGQTIRVAPALALNGGPSSHLVQENRLHRNLPHPRPRKHRLPKVVDQIGGGQDVQRGQVVLPPITSHKSPVTRAKVTRAKVTKAKGTSHKSHARSEADAMTGADRLSCHGSGNQKKKSQVRKNNSQIADPRPQDPHAAIPFLSKTLMP